MKANPYAAELKAENDMLLGVLESNAEMLARIAELEAALRASWRLLHDPDAETADADKVIAVIHKALKGTK